ncbi:MAG: phosphate signaling complex protein PhoU [Acholeplasmataceae bacterium]|jgi:phosphate transport system protein
MKPIDKRLNYLKEMLLKMSDVVIENITMSLTVYQASKETVYINDDIVNQYERLIEEICIDILIREKLFASDLREVVGILRLIADLERIGDHAEDIMKYNMQKRLDEPAIIKDLNIMADKAITLIKDAVDSFVRKDADKADECINKDDEVDALFDKITDELAKIKSTDKEMQKSIIYTSYVAKYLERIADHAVNIAEWVIYIVKGIYIQGG